MTDASAGLHEHADQLEPETIDRHRAIASLMEELEAVDWYDQRVEAAGNAELRAILEHNRDEEKEHAAMVLEWLRRHDKGFEKELRTYLFTDRPILKAEQGATDEASTAPAGDGSLGIGSLKAETES